jgi:hypothetical protein
MIDFLEKRATGILLGVCVYGLLTLVFALFIQNPHH